MKQLNLVIGLSLSALSSTAPARNAAVEIVPQQFIAAFNRGDVAAAGATMTGDVVITDEVAPFHWQGLGAFVAWTAALTSASNAQHISGGKVMLGAPSREIVTADHAYLIAPAVYSFRQNGVAKAEVAQMTFALDRLPMGWRIAAWTWTGPEPSTVK